MGFVSTIYEIDNSMKYSRDFPVFNCLSIDIIENRFQHYAQVPLGELLSARLMTYDKSIRNSKVEESLEKILSDSNSKELIITNIDILFNPDYRLDILKLFMQDSRNRSLIIQWPGVYSNQNLIYSKPEYKDYQKYPIKDYNVICLI